MKSCPSRTGTALYPAGIPPGLPKTVEMTVSGRGVVLVADDEVVPFAHEHGVVAGRNRAGLADDSGDAVDGDADRDQLGMDLRIRRRRGCGREVRDDGAAERRPGGAAD